MSSAGHAGRFDRPAVRTARALARGAVPILGLALLSLALGCAGGPAPTPAAQPPAPTAGYSVVIDAGSQGSRLRVYQWSWEAEEPLPTIHTAPWPRPVDEAEWSAEVEPGLSAFGADPSAAGESLGPLVDVALDSLDPTPDELPPILVLATGGLRRLAAESQEEILEGVRSYLRGRGFERIEAHVVSGRHEALFGWLGGNYILGRLTVDEVGPAARERLSEAAPATLGGLDLGGASAQIAYAIEPIAGTGEPAGENVEQLQLGDLSLHVFVRSDLGFGQDVAEEALAGAACFPPGFSAPAGAGDGDYETCRNGLAEAFRGCQTEPCPPAPDEFPPFSPHFLAVSNYFYTSLMFQLSAPLSLTELESAAEAYCATPWETLRRRYPKVPEKYLGKFCFSAAYIVTLLTEGYGFPYDTRSITAIDRLGGEKIAWTVGALLYDLTRKPRADDP